MNTFDLTHALRDVRTNSVIAICLLIKKGLQDVYRHGLPMRFAGRAFLCPRARRASSSRARRTASRARRAPVAWTDADHLELDGYAGGAIGAEGDLVLTLAGQSSVTESHAPDADITLCGMEVWGNLTLRGTGTLTATGSQCGIHVSQVLVVDGCTVDARADGADITDEAVAGVIAGDMAVRGGGASLPRRRFRSGRARHGVYLQDAGLGAGATGCRLSVDASWLDATGADGGVACLGGSLVSARFCGACRQGLWC